jgi:hypothetical protein
MNVHLSVSPFEVNHASSPHKHKHTLLRGLKRKDPKGRVTARKADPCNESSISTLEKMKERIQQELEELKAPSAAPCHKMHSDSDRCNIVQCLSS